MKQHLNQFLKLKKLIEKTPDKRLAAEGWKKEWKILIATILSAQNRDDRTIPVAEKLFKKYSTPKKLGSASLKNIEKEIKSMNYYKTKARNIKKTSGMIAKKGIPETVEELVGFPGVGRKTANVFLAEARGGAAIGVDTHVARLSRKFGWTKNLTPEKIEKDLEKLFPKKYWNSINYVLVKFGRTFGRSRKNEDNLIKEIKVATEKHL